MCILTMCGHLKCYSEGRCRSSSSVDVTCSAQLNTLFKPESVKNRKLEPQVQVLDAVL